MLFLNSKKMLMSTSCYDYTRRTIYLVIFIPKLMRQQAAKYFVAQIIEACKSETLLQQHQCVRSRPGYHKTSMQCVTKSFIII